MSDFAFLSEPASHQDQFPATLQAYPSGIQPPGEKHIFLALMSPHHFSARMSQGKLEMRLEKEQTHTTPLLKIYNVLSGSGIVGRQKIQSRAFQL